MDINKQVNQHYGRGSIMQQIESALGITGKSVGSLKVDDLAPIDEFHTRGRESTVELANLVNIKPSDLVLDVGCGLGGTARFLAEQYGCQVTGIDLTEEYVKVGKRLTKFVGLDRKVELRKANALQLPLDNDTFDIVWTEHAQMNIADKATFYSEIARVLKPGGHLLFHDIFRGTGEAPQYPAPWAEDESISSLATPEVARQAMEEAGLKIIEWKVKIKESLEFFEKVLTRIQVQGPPPLGIHILMGDNAREKLQNYISNMSQGRVSVALGIAQKS